MNQLSYAYRISDQPIQALAVIRKSNIETANTASEQEYLNVLMVLGAYQQVLTLIQKNPALDSTHAVKRQALLGQFSESIKNAILSSGAFGVKSQNIKADTGRPAHTNYDFEETDYPHE